MKMTYEFQECKVPGIWQVLSFLADDKNPNAWLFTPPDFSSGVRFTFDKKKFYSFYADYPNNLTPEQIKLFNEAYPSLAAMRDWGGYPPEPVIPHA